MALATSGWKPAHTGALPRRAALTLLGVGGAAVGALAGVVAYLTPRRTAKTDVGAVADFPVGEVRHFRPTGDRTYRPIDPSVGRSACDRGGRGFFVLNRPDGLVAFSDQCTHYGAALVHRAFFATGSGCSGPVGGPLTCTQLSGTMPSGRTDSLYCPCHGAAFDPHDGAPAAGPAPRPLDTLPILVDGGRVMVDTDAAHRRARQHEDPVKPTSA